MSENNTPQELEIIIDQLGAFLMKGNALAIGYYKDYESVSDSKGFDQEDYYQKQTSLINDWSQSVADFIIKGFGQNHHYLFHFLVQPSRASMSRSNWPDRVSNIYFAFRDRLIALSEIAFRLEEKLDLSIRREIAKQQVDSSILYEITFTTRRIMLNGILVAKPDFNSENELFFDFVFKQPWERIKVTDIEKELNIKLKKPIARILADLKFTGEMKAIFFPNTSSTAVEFRNPISKGFHSDNNLPCIDLRA